MDISFKGQFKALTDFDWINIPSLAILTGVNGAGKSQLLSLLNEHCYNGISAFTQTYINTQEDYEIRISNTLIEKNGVLFWGPKGSNLNFENLKFGYQDLKLIVTYLKNDIDNKPRENTKLLENQENEEYSAGRNRLKHYLSQKKDRIIQSIEENSCKNRKDLSAAEISYFLPEDIILEDFDLFNQDSLDFIFYMYLYKKEAARRYNLENTNKRLFTLGNVK